MEFRIGRRKGDESTVRIVRQLDGEFYGVFGTVRDLSTHNLLMGNYSATANKWLDKWLLIVGKDDVSVIQFDDRASLKEYLEGLK